MDYGYVIEKVRPGLSEMREYRPPTAEPKPGEKSDRFVIANGSTLLGYPRRPDSPDPLAWDVLAWSDFNDVKAAESKLLTSHAHFLLENRERIFADSRMFLAPVNVQSWAAWVGTFVKPCVGTYIEWWLRRGEENLVHHVSGSALSGWNFSLSIAKDGSLVPLKSNSSVLTLCREFSDVHARYGSERERFDAYSLWEVIARLKGQVPKYEDGFRALMFEHKLNQANQTIFQKWRARFRF